MRRSLFIMATAVVIGFISGCATTGNGPRHYAPESASNNFPQNNQNSPATTAGKMMSPLAQ